MGKVVPEQVTVRVPEAVADSRAADGNGKRHLDVVSDVAKSC